MMNILKILMLSLLLISTAILAKIKSRIWNGVAASKNQFPFNVLIRARKEAAKIVSCGGSIIKENYVLTAAHCTKSAQYVTVFMGDIDFLSGNSYIVFESDITEHPQFDGKILNDIALIKTPKQIFSDSINSVRLPISLLQDFDDEIGITPGWGCTSEIGVSCNQRSQKLLYTELTILSYKRCQNYYYNLIDSYLCAISSLKRPPSFGDSGGAIVLKNSDPKNPIQVGILSAIPELGEELIKPAVYTKISQYISWIEKVTGSVLSNETT